MSLLLRIFHGISLKRFRNDRSITLKFPLTYNGEKLHALAAARALDVYNLYRPQNHRECSLSYLF